MDDETLLKEAVIASMELSKSEAEWNANARKAKRTYGGRYPSWWYKEIVQSGLCGRVAAGWGGSGGITAILG